MHTLIFIQDLAIIMLIAGVSTIVCHLLKQPIVLGYLVAGVIIGPHTPPFSFITDDATVKTLAELGVIFLMFSLGLEFNLNKLSKVGIPALIGAVFEILLMMALGYGIGRMFGWTPIESIFLGAILSVSSTTIIVKALSELKMKSEPFAQLIFGILIVEDIFAILILTLLSGITITGEIQFSEVLIEATKLTSFMVISLLSGILLIPKLLSYIATFKSNEMLLISVLGLCFGFCLVVVKMDYSVALGAFLIGAIIAESRQLKKIEHLINPIRDMFSAMFFVSVGLLFDINTVSKFIIPIIVIIFAIVIGKVISCGLGVLVTGRDGKTAMKVGMGLSQIGEFSFIIASLGITLGATGNFLYSIAVGVSIITTLLTPYLIKHSDVSAQFISGFIPKSVANTFELYTTWIQNIQPNESQMGLKDIIRRSLIQIVINLCIVTAIFLSGAYLAKTNVGNYLTLMTSIHTQKSIICAIALIISLPFIVAIYRKIKALSMLLAEMSVNESMHEKLTFNLRAIISELIPIISSLGILFYLSLLSASILPPLDMLFIVVIVAIIVLVFLFPWFIKIHSKIQASLLVVLNKEKK